MSSHAQNAANQANAQHSTGPKTEEGKSKSCLNNFRHGFCGAFTVLPSEDQQAYDALLSGLRAEHNPQTITETLLVEKMAQHYWLGQRALRLQAMNIDGEKQFSLFLRYQTTNDRAFHKCLSDLLKLRAEKRKAEIGFESQERKRQEHARKEAAEKRKQDLHRWDVLLAEAKADHQLLLTSQLRFNSALSASKNAAEIKAA
ncbi:MAG: hypothetical protein JO097_15705 [Acidobacteriaceae bacterium]|nr:hypothetical protein [Acidobacteriaceae bacterium]